MTTVSRRRFLQVGALGAAALATAGGWSAWRVARASQPGAGPLTPAGEACLLALAPAFLEGAAPADHWTPRGRADFAAALGVTVGTLPPHAQAELRQLFALLAVAPARCALAGRWSGWDSLTLAQGRALLTRWRTSRTALLTSAYQGLHDIVLATWYAAPEHWGPTGYPGPPVLPA